jgi:molecular chaperone HscB
MSVNYFDLLGVAKDFDLNLEVLEDNYLNLQAMHHPDKATTAFERTKSLNISSVLNVAYKTLINDLTRAEYLLSLQGLPLEKCSALDLQDVLLETMHANETLESISDADTLQAFLTEQTCKKTQLLLSMRRAFALQDQKSFLVYTCHLKYLEKTITEAKKRSYLS